MVTQNEQGKVFSLLEERYDDDDDDDDDDHDRQ
jgi:hypothetical protein